MDTPSWARGMLVTLMEMGIRSGRDAIALSKGDSMRNLAKITAVTLFALILAANSWAGGASCTQGGAKSTSGAPHCTGRVTDAMAHECGVKANQVMYSFSVASAECDRCITSIQKAAASKKGIACVHVDLSSHTAYVIADKNVSQKDISKLIAEAGFKNKFTGQGSKVQAAFTKAIASGEKSVSCCSKGKDRV